MAEQQPLRVTRAVLADMETDEMQAALATLGPAIHALDVTARDAGYRLEIKITRDAALTSK